MKSNVHRKKNESSSTHEATPIFPEFLKWEGGKRGHKDKSQVGVGWRKVE